MTQPKRLAFSEIADFSPPAQKDMAENIRA